MGKALSRAHVLNEDPFMSRSTGQRRDADAKECREDVTRRSETQLFRNVNNHTKLYQGSLSVVSAGFA